MRKAAFIGLGAMGEPMAGHLLKKGFEVTIVGNRRPEPVARLREQGARVAATPAEAMRECEAAILCLPTSSQVEAVIKGPGGLVETAKSGSIVVDCTTSDPTSTRRLAPELAARGIGLVDAPMTRGVAGAKQGKLAYFIAGDPAHVDKAKAFLDAMGDTYFPMGAPGNGHAAKIISNVLTYTTVAAVNEALMLGSGFGLDYKLLHEALMAGANSKALDGWGPRIAAREYKPPRVTVGHVCEDMVLIARLAKEMSVPLQVTGTAAEAFRRVSGMGHDESDMASLADAWPKSLK